MNVAVVVRSNDFDRISRRTPRVVHELVEVTCRRIEAIVKVGMAEQKSGVVYGSHQASAPGEMPAIDTGNLANSVQVEFETETVAIVFTNADYAANLEYGTMRMAPRPFFVPAAEEVRPQFEADARRIGESL